MTDEYYVCSECESARIERSKIDSETFINYAEVVGSDGVTATARGWVLRYYPTDGLQIESEQYCPSCSADDAIFDERARSQIR